MVQGYVDTLNGQLNRWETIKKFEILDHDLTVESGELTPSMKVKRNVVEVNNTDADQEALRLLSCRGGQWRAAPRWTKTFTRGPKGVEIRERIIWIRTT